MADSASVVAIGNFDGVHRAHQRLLQSLRTHSRVLSSEATVVTFEPHPQSYFQPDVVLARLSSAREKLELLQRYGVDRVIALRFNDQLAALSAEAFVKHYLVDVLAVSHVVVGYDFGFGAGRAGTAEQLEALGKDHGFGVTRVPAVILDGEEIGSTRIRLALRRGDLSLAERLLGRPYTLSGRVAYGDQRGRSWGFPTANLPLTRHNPPLRGVYAVEVEGAADRSLPGVANLGLRPTVGANRLLLEVHLIEFDGALYGKRLRVTFRKQIRTEKKFNSFDALQLQIRKDTDAAAHWLRENDGGL